MPTAMDDSPSAPAAANTSSTSPTHPHDGAVTSPMVVLTKPSASDGDACERLNSPGHMMTPKTLSFLRNLPDPNAPAAPPAAPSVAAVSSVPLPIGFPSFVRAPGAIYGSALHGAAAIRARRAADVHASADDDLYEMSSEIGRHFVCR